MSAPMPTPPTGGSQDAPPAPTGEQTNPPPPADEKGTDSPTRSAGQQQGEQGSPSTATDVEALRSEVADWRTKAESAQQDFVDKIAKALGINGSGETPTVEQVTDQLTAAQKDARERSVDLAVYRTAGAAGADPDALLDSTSFRRRVADLDPTTADFAEKVTAAITAAVKENPRLSAAPAAAPRSGGQITGGSPTGDDDLGSLPVEDYIERTRKRSS